MEGHPRLPEPSICGNLLVFVCFCEHDTSPKRKKQKHIHIITSGCRVSRRYGQFGGHCSRPVAALLQQAGVVFSQWASGCRRSAAARCVARRFSDVSQRPRHSQVTHIQMLDVPHVYTTVQLPEDAATRALPLAGPKERFVCRVEERILADHGFWLIRIWRQRRST